MYSLPPEHVPQLFTCSKSVYRILADGQFRELTHLVGGRLVGKINGEVIQATDIAWCLHYGNWPKFPLVQLDGNPHNCSLDNLMPARLNRLRYRETEKDGLYYHPLSATGFRSPETCRLNWAVFAREHYMKDLDYVLHLEAQERELRRGVPVPELPKIRTRGPNRPRTPDGVVRSTRPAPVEGMEWHWYEGKWISVPVACHIADDYLERIRKWLAGAVRFAFNPDYQEVWGYNEAGAVVR